MPSVINCTTTNGLVTSADNSGSLALQTNNGTTAVTIDTNQNVGIGTSSPGQVLEVSKSQDTETQVRVVNANTGSSARSGFVLGNNSNAGAASLLLNSSNNTGLGGANSLNIYMGLSAPIAFFTNAAERMRITSGGDLLYNCTGLTNDAPNGNGRINQTNGNEKVRVAADTQVAFQFYSPTGGTSSPVGTISVNASSVGFNTTSDYRLKENIAPMTGALDKVSQLKPCTYTWKSTGEQGQGFIAHELQAVIPDAVSGEKDAVNEEGNPVHQGVDTSFLVATLTAAIQELNAKVEAQAARIAELEGAK